MCIRSDAVLHQEGRSKREKENDESDSREMFSDLGPSLREGRPRFANDFIMSEAKREDDQEKSEKK